MNWWIVTYITFIVLVVITMLAAYPRLYSQIREAVIGVKILPTELEAGANEKTAIEKTKVFASDFERCISFKDSDCICGARLQIDGGYFARLAYDEKELKVMLLKGEIGEDIGAARLVETFYVGADELCLFSEDKKLVNKWIAKVPYEGTIEVGDGELTELFTERLKNELYGSILDIDNAKNKVWFMDEVGNEWKHDLGEINILSFYKGKAGQICLVLGAYDKRLCRLNAE